MRIHRHHLSRREAERLLDDPATHGSALGTLLAAAGGPAQPGELGGEDAAASAFHRTGMVPSTGGGTLFVPAPRRGGRAAARAVVATGAVVALASGGFALAGSADLPHIPGLPGQGSDRATESVAEDPKPSEASSTSATPGDEASATGGPGTGGSGSPSSAPTSSPTPNLEGLCRAFQATDHSANGSSLDSAAFAALVAAAGGTTEVADYCIDLVGEPKDTGKPSVLPTPDVEADRRPRSRRRPPTPTPRPPGPPRPSPRASRAPRPASRRSRPPRPTREAAGNPECPALLVSSGAAAFRGPALDATVFITPTSSTEISPHPTATGTGPQRTTAARLPPGAVPLSISGD